MNDAPAPAQPGGPPAARIALDDEEFDTLGAVA